jgi:hypothetical protein
LVKHCLAAASPFRWRRGGMVSAGDRAGRGPWDGSRRALRREISATVSMSRRRARNSR